MDSITKKVKELYETHPYPYTEVKDELLNDLLLMIYYAFYESQTELNHLSEFRFFDAGCGSGHRILGVASEFSRSHFTCVDICKHSLEIAQKQAQKHGITNVTFRAANLMQLEENDKYDIVTSVGVIHHLSDPGKALANISRLVADDGLLIVLLYHTYGEHERMLKRNIVRTLNQDGSIEMGKQIIKELGYSLPADHYGPQGYNSNLTEYDQISKDLDVFLHPQVVTYTFQEGIELFRGTDMEWAAVNSANSRKHSFLISTSSPVEDYSADPGEYLKSPYLLSIYNRLSTIDQLRVLESFIQPTAFSLVAGRKASLKKIGTRLNNNLTWLI